MTERLSRTRYFAEMLKLIAKRSTCARRAVGAVITDDYGHVLSTGYNGVPRGFVHCTDVPCPGADDVAGDTRRCMAVHAEINAMLQCADLDRARVIYVTCEPCFSCAKAITNTKIRRVVAVQKYADPDGVTTLARAGIEVINLGETEFESF